MKLFQYAIVYKGKVSKKEEEEGKEPENRIIRDVQSILARDEKEAVLRIAREIPEEYLSKLDRVEVIIRPF